MHVIERFPDAEWPNLLVVVRHNHEHIEIGQRAEEGPE